jgi:hypothetical protein
MSVQANKYGHSTMGEARATSERVQSTDANHGVSTSSATENLKIIPRPKANPSSLKSIPDVSGIDRTLHDSKPSDANDHDQIEPNRPLDTQMSVIMQKWLGEPVREGPWNSYRVVRAKVS